MARDDDNALAPQRETRLTIPVPRLTYTGRASRATIRQDLVEAVEAAADRLPEGYRVEVYSGARKGGLKSSRHHGGNAIDVQIFDPQGNAIPNEGPAGGGGMYRQLAHGIYNETYKRSPELAAQMAWGGEFETKPGSGIADYMHFDYGGRRGRWPQEGWAVVADPAVSTAAATSPAPPASPVVAADPAAPARPQPVAFQSPLPVGDPSTWPQTYNIPPALQGGLTPTPVSTVPLATPSANALAPPPAVPPPNYATSMLPPESGFSTGQTVVTPPTPTRIPGQPLPIPRSVQAPEYADAGEGTGYGTGLGPAGARPDEQPSTSYQPFPDLTESLYSGGAVPSAVRAEREATPTAPTPTVPPDANVYAAGGPTDQKGEATRDGFKPIPPGEMNSNMMMAMIAAMMAKSLKVSPIDYDPFLAVAKAGKLSTEFPKSASAYSPLGKLTPGGPPGTASSSVEGRVAARRAAMPDTTLPPVFRMFQPRGARGVGYGGETA